MALRFHPLARTHCMGYVTLHGVINQCRVRLAAGPRGKVLT
jgi:hypothetical protein